MKVFPVLVSIMLPLITGFLLVSILWPKDRPAFSDLSLKCCLSVGFGFGTSSCLVFAWMLVVGRLTRGVFVCDLILVVGLCAFLVRQQRIRTVLAPNDLVSIPILSLKSPYLLRLAVCIASLSAGLRFWSLSVQNPHGQFDAYAIWNLRARFLYRGDRYWTQFAHMTWSHPDYPLLIPASIARSWEFIGRETQVIPSAIGLLFTFATIGIVAIAISHLRGEWQGLLAALVLLGTPFFTIQGASQYADVPLSFFFVATVALLFLHSESPSQVQSLTLAGMAAAFSAWTKNEGILFVSLLLLLYCVVVTAKKGRKYCGKELGALLMGAAPIIVIIVIYKVYLTSTNDLIAAQTAGSTVHRLLDASRYHLVMSEFVRELPRFGGWSPTFPMPLVLFFYLLIVGTSVEGKDRAGAITAALLPVLMLRKLLAR